MHSTKSNAPSLASQSKTPQTTRSATSGIEGKVQPIDGEPFRFLVLSEKSPNNPPYLVDLQAYGWTGQCGCMDFATRHGPKAAAGERGQRLRCKHIVTAREWFLEHVLPKLAVSMGMEEPDILTPVGGSEYMLRKQAFLMKYPMCAVFPKLHAVDVHHSRGRLGPLLMDERFWIPVSRIGHVFIHDNRARARELNWRGIPLLAAIGDWNRKP